VPVSASKQFATLAGPAGFVLLQCSAAMSDWRQIQARIRKAKVTADPAGQLAALYERTRDAMVAFELARHHEKRGENQEAARWYTAAAERFRRAQWKLKAQEALARLGVAIPIETAAPNFHAEAAHGASSSQAETLPPAPVEEHRAAIHEDSIGEPSVIAAPQPARESDSGRKRRRRGRRGGRGRRRGQGETAGPSHTRSSAGASLEPVAPAPPLPPIRLERPAPESLTAARPEPREPAPELAGESSLAPVRGRAGDPGLSSRIALLESQLRRLLASPLFRVEQSDQAPAGPGVFLLSDSEQTTYYYIEECQTLRIGVANLLRSERAGTSRRGGEESLRARFAEHLEISEPKVAKYLRDYCAVRWLQLDEGAPRLAHFAIAVLRPVLND